jgi:hypothetical protein
MRKTKTPDCRSNLAFAGAAGSVLLRRVCRRAVLFVRRRMSMTTTTKRRRILMIRRIAIHRAWRTQFIRRQLAVAVLVELQQGSGGVGDFVSVDYAVVIGIQRGNDRRRETMPARAHSVGGHSALTMRCVVSIVLSDQASSRASNSQCNEEERCFCFHDLVFGFVLVTSGPTQPLPGAWTVLILRPPYANGP